jgi:hypothetical protein
MQHILGLVGGPGIPVYWHCKNSKEGTAHPIYDMVVHDVLLIDTVL